MLIFVRGWVEPVFKRSSNNYQKIWESLNTVQEKRGAQRLKNHDFAENSTCLYRRRRSRLTGVAFPKGTYKQTCFKPHSYAYQLPR